MSYFLVSRYVHGHKLWYVFFFFFMVACLCCFLQAHQTYGVTLNAPPKTQHFQDFWSAKPTSTASKDPSAGLATATEALKAVTEMTSAWRSVLDRGPPQQATTRTRVMDPDISVDAKSIEEFISELERKYPEKVPRLQGLVEKFENEGYDTVADLDLVTVEELKASPYKLKLGTARFVHKRIKKELGIYD